MNGNYQMCSISEDPRISFQFPTTGFALLALKLIFFNLTEHFNHRIQASSIFKQLSLSSFVIINMGHPDRSRTQHNSIHLSGYPARTQVLGLALNIFNL